MAEIAELVFGYVQRLGSYFTWDNVKFLTIGIAVVWLLLALNRKLAVLSLLVFPVGRAVNSFTDSNGDIQSEEALRHEMLAEREQLKKTHPYVVGSVIDVMAFNSKVIPHNPLDQIWGPESDLAFFAKKISSTATWWGCCSLITV